MATYSITGKVTNLAQQPIAGAEVRAFGRGPGNFAILLGKPVSTDEFGDYSIYDADFRIDGKEPSQVDIIVVVYAKDGKVLGQSPLLKKAEKASIIDLQVDDANNTSLPNEEQVSISGKLISPNGLPLKGMKIRALIPEIGISKVVQEATTNDKGEYQFVVHKDYKNIKLVWGDELDKPLLNSGLLQIKEQGNVFDFVLKSDDSSSPKSEFEEIQGKILPFIDKIPVADLKEDDNHTDLLLLAQKTGLDIWQLALFVLAHRYADRVGAKVGPELFYGLMRQGYIYDVNTLLSFNEEHLRNITDAAQKENIIGADVFSKVLGTVITQYNITKKQDNAFSDRKSVV